MQRVAAFRRLPEPGRLRLQIREPHLARRLAQITPPALFESPMRLLWHRGAACSSHPTAAQINSTATFLVPAECCGITTAQAWLFSPEATPFRVGSKSTAAR